jgi:hypothetical protein
VAVPAHDLTPADRAGRSPPSGTDVFGAVWAQAELRKVLGAIGARIPEGEVAVGRAGEYQCDNPTIAGIRR